MKTTLQLILGVFLALFTFNTQAQYKVHTSDITNFWEAYDAVQSTTDTVKQMAYLQELYVDRGTVGLEEFMELRGGTPGRWRQFIEIEKARLERIRPFTLSVLQQKNKIDQSLERFKNMYPDFRDGDVFFTIGIGNSGGTVKENHVLIGCEVVASEDPEWAVPIVMHEFVHTQQLEGSSGHLLAHSIHEGMADFISELFLDKKIADYHPNGYIAFSTANKDDLWEHFKKFISASDPYDYHGWLYGDGGQTINGTNMNDLGYGMGYLICKSFYENADDKQAAIKEMLTTEFTDENARDFLLRSGFVPQKDIRFVQTFEFAPLPIIDGKKIRKVQYGYKLKRNFIEFKLKPSEVPFAIDKLTVAGTFNNWNPKNDDYQLQLEKGKYVLRVPRDQFEKGKKHYFKFVANGSSWLAPPAKAKNAEGDGSGNVNLYVEL